MTAVVSVPEPESVPYPQLTLPTTPYVLFRDADVALKNEQSVCLPMTTDDTEVTQETQLAK